MLFWRYASVVIILLSINDVCGLHFRKLGRNTRINTKLRSRNEHDFGSLYSKNVMKVGSMLLSGNLIFAQPIKSFGMDTPWYCSDNVVTLNDKSGREVVVVGTAHISEDSVDLVRKAIRDVKPDTVMIELDKKRLGKADNSKGSLKDFGFTEPAPRNAIQPSQPLRISDDALSASSAGGGALSDNVGSIATIQKSSYEKVSPLRQITSYLQEAAQKVAGVVLGKALGQFYSSVEKLGFTAGGEFKAAVEEARALNAQVLLGDRDVDVTLKRLASALGSVDPTRLNVMLTKLTQAEKELGLPDATQQDLTSMDKDSLSQLVEGLKQKDTVAKLAGIIRSELPSVYNALIGERDEYMANAIVSSDSRKLVGVVGLGHLAGIEQYLTASGLKSVLRDCTLMPPSNVK